MGRFDTESRRGKVAIQESENTMYEFEDCAFSVDGAGQLYIYQFSRADIPTLFAVWKQYISVVVTP